MGVGAISTAVGRNNLMTVKSPIEIHVVEDDVTTNAIIRSILGKAGFRTVASSDVAARDGIDEVPPSRTCFCWTSTSRTARVSMFAAVCGTRRAP